MAKPQARSIAFAKTTRPAVGQTVPRERLFVLLDRARERPVVWVSGPPGCGKTTAVASYLEHEKADCLWYQLDEGDADVATFFYYLGLAAEEHGVGGLPLLMPEYHAAMPVFTRRYFEALYARLKPPFVVVFDGYHEVAAFSAFHQVMRDALAVLPQGGCAVLVSRGDPPAEMARLRASSAVSQLGWEDLRLTRDETASIARQRLPLPDGELDQIYTRTQGWAAGLVLLLEQAKVTGSVAEAPELATGQPVFDYLAGEIFEKTDAGTQDLLLKTAYLSHMTAAMAQSLTGNEHAGRILAELHRNQYFVALRQARPEPVYQYHPMFREFLVARIEEVCTRDARRASQKTAAAAMESAGQIEDAIGLYRDSYDWDAMARLIGAHAEAMLAQGRGETLMRWAEELPPDARDRHPWLVYWSAASRAQLAPREARVRYEKAFELFRAQSPAELTGMALSASGAMDAILYELDDFSLLDRWIAVVDAAERDGVRYPSAAVQSRVACSMVFSLTLRQPQRRDLEQWIERALGCAREVADPNLKIFVGLLCSLTLMWTGLYAKAQALIEAMRRFAAAPGVSPFSQLTLKNVEAMYFMLTAQREPCLRASDEGLEIAQSTGVHTWSFQLLVYAYGGALAGQDLDAAAALARKLEPHAPTAGRFNLCLYHHFQAWEAMLRKDLMRALQQERVALRMAMEVGCPYFEVLCRLALAEILAECGDERRSIAHLQELRPQVEAVNNRHLEFTCLVGFGRLALDHSRQRASRQHAGHSALRRGLALGREYGYAHFLWWRPAAMARTCAHALEAGIETDYVKSLIRQRGLKLEAPSPSAGTWPWAFRVRTLGAFSLLRHDEPMPAVGKAQRRPLELLQALIAHGGERVPVERLAESLWPRIDGDSAHRSFTTTLHRLRKLLGEDRALVLHESKLTLDRRYFWVDIWAFEELIAEIDGAQRAPRAAAGHAGLDGLAQRLLDLYRGPFLAAEPEAPWQLQRRERLRGRFARAVAALERAWREAGEAPRAAEFLDQCAEIDPQMRPIEEIIHK